MILYNIHVILFASILLALYLFITHPCIFFIYHQVVQKPFIKFINNGFQTNESLINDLNVPSFLSLSLSLSLRIHSRSLLGKKCKQSVYKQSVCKQENAMRYNNRDDLLQLSFTLKISVFSEVYI